MVPDSNNSNNNMYCLSQHRNDNPRCVASSLVREARVRKLDTCVRACMRAYMRTCMHACMHACIHTYIHAYVNTCTHAYMHTCIHAYMHYMHTCITCTHACMHAYMHTCIHYTVGNPHRAQLAQFDLFELVLLLKSDKQLPVEQFEAAVAQSTVPSPPLMQIAARLVALPSEVCACPISGSC